MPDPIAYLDTRLDPMVQLVSRLANINSYSHHLPGLAVVAELLRQEFAALAPDTTDTIPLPPAQALSATGETLQSPLGELLSFTKRPQAPLQALLVIHYDTVYAPDHSFKSVTREDQQTLRGPAVPVPKAAPSVMPTACLPLHKPPPATNTS